MCTKVAAGFLCLLMWSCGCVRSQISAGNVSQCDGVFDFYFVVDSSGSVLNDFQPSIVPFVENVAANFVNLDFRISIITFATISTVYLPLTPLSSSDEVNEGFEALRSVVPVSGGETFLGRGLSRVNNQIDDVGGDRASVIFIFTDGAITDFPNALDEAEEALGKGARIFIVGIGLVDESQLSRLVGSEDQLYIGSRYDYLDTILPTILNATCYEITTADIETLCLGATTDVTLTGKGFTYELVPGNAACRFWINETYSLMTQPSGSVQYDVVVCPIPSFVSTGDYLIEFTPNGIVYISSDLNVNVTDCTDNEDDDDDEDDEDDDEDDDDDIIDVLSPDLTGVMPVEVCMSSLGEATLTGTNFMSQLDQGKAVCRFTMGTDETVTFPTQPIKNNTVVCPLPKLEELGEMIVEVSLNGITYISGMGNISIVDCDIPPEVSAVDPGTVCIGQSDELTVVGKGFTDDLDEDKSECKYENEDGDMKSFPPKDVKYGVIVCPLPDFNETGVVSLVVILNYTSNVSVTTTVNFVLCTEKSSKSEDLAYVAGIILGLLALILLLALCLLWCCFPVISGEIVGGLPPEPKEPEPVPKPPRKWEVVDASYYGGRGAGGIKPMTVRWGKDGATEEGSKLTKAKDANVVNVVEEPGSVLPPKPPKPGCWDLIKLKLKRWYAVIASYRPVRGETKWIICCPGPHHILKQGKYPSSNPNETSAQAQRNGSMSKPHRPMQMV